MKPLCNGEPSMSHKIDKNHWEYDMGCCDCGLVHHIHFWVYKENLWMKSYRDDFETIIIRSKKRKKKK